ncbi:MAG: DNA polymerase III subunit delta', partial [Erythrobacter sp.]
MLLGHDEPWREWRKAMAGERMHHAWLLAGRRGVGKGSFALAAARELVGAAAGEGGQHPDIHTLTYAPKDDKEERKRADGKPYELARSIRIAQIRAMQSRLGTRPTLGDRRAIIIDPADD